MKLFKHRAALWLLVLGSLIPLTFAGSVVAANPSTVNLGVSDSFAILSGAGVTNVPTSTIRGDVGASPITGAAIGLTCPQVTGTIYAVDAFGPAPCAVANPGLLTTAKNDLTAAYGNAAGRTPDSTFGAADNQLGGRTLVPGIYRFGAAATANLIGNLTLAGDESSVWIFQASSTLVAQSASTITLTGGAQACNIFWQVGSSATIRTGAAFVGTIMADQSICTAVRRNTPGSGRWPASPPSRSTTTRSPGRAAPHCPPEQAPLPQTSVSSRPRARLRSGSAAM